MKFDNDELLTLGVGQLEPEDDFSSPQPGSIVCARVKGAKYSCIIVEEVGIQFMDIVRHIIYASPNRLLVLHLKKEKKGNR